jgi:hypothetical protein
MYKNHVDSSADACISSHIELEHVITCTFGCTNGEMHVESFSEMECEEFSTNSRRTRPDRSTLSSPTSSFPNVCTTVAPSAYFAVSIDSLGYYEYNRRLYLELGLEMSSISATFYKQQDRRTHTDQVYTNKPERRKTRAEQRLANINKEWKEEVIDKQNGNTYQSAMMAPNVAPPTTP